jgi:hypothetical protein
MVPVSYLFKSRQMQMNEVKLFNDCYHNSKFKKKLSYILMSFLKKLITDLPTKRLIFKPKQGKIET